MNYFTCFWTLLAALLPVVANGQITLGPESKTVQSGDTFFVNVIARNFPLMVSCQGSVNWDPDVISPVSTNPALFVSNFGLGSFSTLNIGMSQANLGRMAFAWSYPFGLDGEQTDTVFFRLRFIANGDNGTFSDIQISEIPTPTEFAAPDPVFIFDLFSPSFLVGTITVGGTLPVEWQSVEARTLPEGIAVSWTTAREVNTDYFEVQRMDAQGGFVTLNKVAAAGNSSRPNRYEYLDAAALLGRSVYRILQTDLDGATSFSQKVEASRTQLGLEMYPNPAKTFIEISLPDSWGMAGVCTLYDLQGKAVAQQSIVNRLGEQVHLNGLPAGWYQAAFRSESGLIARGRFFKEN